MLLKTKERVIYFLLPIHKSQKRWREWSRKLLSWFVLLILLVERLLFNSFICQMH